MRRLLLCLLPILAYGLGAAPSQDPRTGIAEGSEAPSGPVLSNCVATWADNDADGEIEAGENAIVTLTCDTNGYSGTYRIALDCKDGVEQTVGVSPITYGEKLSGNRIRYTTNGCQRRNFTSGGDKEASAQLYNGGAAVEATCSGAGCSGSQTCTYTINGSIQADVDFTVTVSGAPVGGDDAPVIGSVALSESTCTSPCSSLVANGATTNGTNTPLVWKHDADASCDPDPGVSPCSDACWTNIENNPMTNGALPDFTTLGQNDIRFCVQDADDDAAYAETSVVVQQQTLVASMVADPVTCTAGVDCTIDMILTVDQGATTCPWDSGDGYDLVSGACGSGCSASSFALTNSTTSPRTLIGACTCPAGTSGQHTATATLSGCGTATAVQVSAAYNVIPAPVDPVPEIESAAFAVPTCTAGTDCDDVRFNGTCVAGTCDDAPVAWHYDSDSSCGISAAPSDCGDPCYDATVDASGGTDVPTFAATPVPRTANVWVCVQDTDGDDSAPVQLSMQIAAAPATYDTSLLTTPAGGQAPQVIAITAQHGGTFSGSVAVSATSCGGGTADANFSSHAPVSAPSGPDPLGTCTYTAAGTYTISATLTPAGGSAVVRTAQVTITDPTPTDIALTVAPINSAQQVITSGDEPLRVSNVRVYLTGSCYAQAGIQPTTDVCLDTTDDGTWDYCLDDLNCYDANNVPADCSATSGGNAWVSFLARDAQWPSGGIDYYADTNPEVHTLRAKATACGVTRENTAQISVNDLASPSGNLVATPTTSIVWNYNQGGTAPTTREVVVTSANGIELDFTATESPLVSWLTTQLKPTSVTGYTTTFESGAENPLSEGGAWVMNNPQTTPGDGSGWNRLQVIDAGDGFATQANDWGHYDGVAHLTGFQPDQWIEATWWMDPAWQFNASTEATLSVRMTTRASPGCTTPGACNDPMLQTYALAVKSYGNAGGPRYSNLLFGIWDGNSNWMTEPNVFYGSLTPFFTGACANAPMTGDRLRFSVQGTTPVLNAWLQRSGSSVWTQCYSSSGYTVTGPESIYSLQSATRPYGPSWHVPLTTGNPGLTSFTINDGGLGHAGWSSASAGVCPPLPQSCAP